MSKLARIMLGAIILGAASTAATAANPKIRPGLWLASMGGQMGEQISARMKQMEAEMAKMPKELQEQMRAMMSERMAGMANGMKMCITPEMAARGPGGPPNEDSSCEQSFKWTSATRGKFSMQCEDGTRGSGDMVIASPKSYATTMNISNSDGSSQKMEMSGKWLSDDCGSVKPMEMPKR